MMAPSPTFGVHWVRGARFDAQSKAVSAPEVSMPAESFAEILE
jgi:hypothetical protein